MPEHKDDNIPWFHLILQINCLNLRLLGVAPHASEWFRLSVSLTTLTAKAPLSLSLPEVTCLEICEILLLS